MSDEPNFTPIKTFIDEIRETEFLKSFPNRQAQYQGIIRPMLKSLGWPTENWKIATESPDPQNMPGVDWLLRKSEKGTPCILVGVSKDHNAVSELDKFAKRLEAKLIVVTNGFVWRVHVATHTFPKPPGDTLVAELALEGSEDTNELAEAFWSLLSRDAALEGTSLPHANKLHWGKNLYEIAEQTAESVWRTLIDNKDSALIQALALPLADKLDSSQDHEAVFDASFSYLKKLKAENINNPLADEAPIAQEVPENAPTHTSPSEIPEPEEDQPPNFVWRYRQNIPKGKLMGVFSSKKKTKTEWETVDKTTDEFVNHFIKMICQKYYKGSLSKLAKKANMPRNVWKLRRLASGDNPSGFMKLQDGKTALYIKKTTNHNASAALISKICARLQLKYLEIQVQDNETWKSITS